MRWLSSDPIRVGDFYLPLRPVVGLLAAVVVLMGVNAVLDDAPDSSTPELAGTESIPAPGYPRPVAGYPAPAAGAARYQADAYAPAPHGWQWEMAGRVPVNAPLGPVQFSGGAISASGSNGYPARYRAGGDQHLGSLRDGKSFGYRGAGPAPAAYHGFRFRNDDVPNEQRPAYWADRDAYRFRPLTDHDRERMYEDIAERPAAFSVGAPSLYSDLTGSYGDVPEWQPAPQEGPDFSRTW